MKKYTDSNLIIWTKDDKATIEELEQLIQSYEASSELAQLKEYDNYYDVENSLIRKKVQDRMYKRITPNELLPSAYYKTVVDTMAGYMFSNVSYTPKADQDDGYSQILNIIFEDASIDIKDMATGIYALGYNKACELVYTTGDKKNKAKVNVASLDPRQIIAIYDDSIEPDLYFAIRVVESPEKDYDYTIDVFYKDEWQKYNMKDGKLSEREGSIPLFWSTCPVVVYRSEIVNYKSPFDQIINYINALDILLTNNANDAGKLADAILALSMALEDDQKRHLDDLKVVDNMDKDSIVEYITKDMSPEFRKYISELFVKEIHKHSHTVDWFSDSTGGNEASARALRVRLFDMDNFSQRIEKVYRKGAYKRIDLINDFLTKNGIATGEIKIEFNRTLPDQFLDMAAVLQNITFIDDETKLKKLGFSNDEIGKIMIALTAQKEKNMDLFDKASNTENTEEDTDENTDEEV